MTNDEELPPDPPERGARRFRITGRVQGVGFRYFARKRAQALGLAGWVRNLPDGDVEVHVEGPSEGVEQVLLLLGRGPAGAEVEAIEVIEVEPIGARTFEVRA